MKKTILLDHYDATDKILLVDLDNTLFGAMNALERHLDWYHIEGQETYSFKPSWREKAQEGLDAFHKEEVLRDMDFIPEVVEVLEKFLSRSTRNKVMIVTKTRPENAELRLELALQNEILKNRCVGIMVWQDKYPIKQILTLFDNVVGLVDDNPSNWEVVLDYGIPVAPVLYKYNENFARLLLNKYNTFEENCVIVPAIKTIKGSGDVIYANWRN